MPQGNEQRSKHVAFLVHHAAHVAFGVTFTLQAFVEVIDHRRHMFGHSRVFDHETARIGDPEHMQAIDHVLGPPDQNGCAITEVPVLDRRPQGDIFFGFREDHAFRVGLALFINARECRGCGIEPRLEIVAIGIEIFDRGESDP